MRTAFSLAFAGLIVLILNACMSEPPLPDSSWKLVFADEFDYTGLPDESRWDWDVGGTGWGNNEEQYYTDRDLRNARVGDGVLTIELKKSGDQLAPGTFGFYKDYTSARLVSRGKASWTYGRFEMRARLPSAKGVWPAFWLLPDANTYGQWPGSGEIDIMEFVGYQAGIVHNAIHTRAHNHLDGTQLTSSTQLEESPDGFHTYRLDWLPDRLEMSVDGVTSFSYANPGTGDSEWPFDQPFHLILNLAWGGNWGGSQGTDPEALPQHYVIDYVRVYSKP